MVCVCGSGTRPAGWTASWTCSRSSTFSTASRAAGRCSDSGFIFTRISLQLPQQLLVAPPPSPPAPPPPLSDASQLLIFTSVHLSSFCTASRSVGRHVCEVRGQVVQCTECRQEVGLIVLPVAEFTHRKQNVKLFYDRTSFLFFKVTRLQCTLGIHSFICDHMKMNSLLSTVREARVTWTLPW